MGIGPDSAEAYRKYWAEHALPFVGLPDPAHTVAKIYGQQVKILKLGRMPALFIVDREGLIRWQQFGNSMSDIPENGTVLAIIDEIEKETR